MTESKFTEAGFNARFNKTESTKYGIVLGVISLVLGILVLYISKAVQSFWVLTALSFGINTILYMVIALFFTYSLRKRNGGIWNFSIALKSTFLMLLISTVIATLSTMLYVHVINPGIQEDVLRNTINLTIEQMENSGVENEVIDSRVAALEEQMNAIGHISFKDVFRGLMISILMQFIFSLILAAITRNEKLLQTNKMTNN
ncbi:DUF4199 domain-containing protein [Sphingobacterium thermophilum]|uniref:DUF4199 domain-containing protein n=1 Tax=Sphingobacterium thermophilum TaxID=768534 RepID=A0ABP8QWL0_9SPHI